MSLSPGTRLGPYEVVALLGAGGMGEVYRARDSRLRRDVALKILPDAFASDPDRLARFEREAQVLASLSHPNLATVYGLEEAVNEAGGSYRAIVMELVEGPTLADRLARGALPLDEALAVARQIASGVELAHERGIVHRDLKPANIKLSGDGIVKVLDFGLAKLWEKEPLASGADPANSPTMTGAGLTSAGIILGTAAYMSPEQARGRKVDQRADIWAFGCILFEMLAGTPAFGGETATDILARVMERDPDWSKLPATTPPNVTRVLRRCLEKDPTRRLRHIGDARLEFDDARDPQAVATAPQASRWSRVLPWSVAGLLALATAAAFATRPATSTASLDVLHFDIVNPAGVEVQAGITQSFGLSPDGTRIAFVGVRDGMRKIFVRDVAGPEVAEIPGSTGVNTLAFSSDGTAIAFISASSSLTTFQFGDSATRVLPATGDPAGGLDWGTQGIVFQKQNSVWIVDPTGGAPRQLTTLDAARDEVVHAVPIWLDDRVIVFASLTNQAGTERIETVTLDAQPRRTVIMERARRPAWSPTGHLLFDRDGALLAVPFDLDTLKATGPASVVLPAGTVSPTTLGGLSVQVSAAGTLAYLPAGYGNRRIVIVGRDGSSVPLDYPAARFTNPRFSHDGTRLALDEDLSSQVVIDLARGTKVALQQPAFGSGWVSWNSDGSRLAYRRYNQPYSISADGKRDGAPIKGADATDFPTSAGATPDELLMVRIHPETSGDVYLFSLSGAHPPKALISGRGYQGGPQLSPDKRWLLYQSDETGQPEIYVRAYPVLDRGWQVSVGGGVQPRWGAGGREVLYRAGGPMVAVAFDGRGDAPALGKPQTLFDQAFDYGQGISIANYDVSRDGRLVMLRAEPGVAPFHVIRNWAEGLKGK